MVFLYRKQDLIINKGVLGMTQPLLEKISDAKDRALASLVNDLLSSEYFSFIMERVVSAGGYIDQHIQQTLNTVRVASKREIEDLEERLILIERKLGRVVTSIEEIRSGADVPAASRVRATITGGMPTASENMMVNSTRP